MLDEIIAESQTLRITGNRLRVKLVAANLLWPHNEARSRVLFKEVSASLIEMNNEIDRTDPESGNKIQQMAQLRQAMLQLLARRDAALAREFLRATRQSPATASTETVQTTNRRYRQPDEERQMELSLASELAATDPKQALQIARENLSKGFSYELIGILNQLQQKDQEAAAKLASDIMTKLRTENLETNQEAANMAINLLRMAVNPPALSSAAATQTLSANANTTSVITTNSNGSTLTATATTSTSNSNNANSTGATTKNTTPILDQAAIKDLVEMIAAAAVNNTGNYPMLLMSLRDMMPIVEKYAPARVPALRRKLAASNAVRDAETYEGSEFGKYRGLMENGTTEEILEAASKAPPEMREWLYQMAVSKAKTQGELDRARQIISERVTDPAQRARMLLELDRQVLVAAAAQGKLDQVRQMISRLRSNEERAGALVMLATTIAQRGDKKTALQLLDEARGMTSVRAKNSKQLMTQLAVAKAYVSLDPSRSFTILEPMVDQLNELIAAGALLGGFFAEEFVQDDEIAMDAMSMMLGSLASTEYAGDLATLAGADFERTKALADRFQRPEVRVIARLLIAQSTLSDQQSGAYQNRTIGVIAPVPPVITVDQHHAR